jgi:hypothetical protein
MKLMLYDLPVVYTQFSEYELHRLYQIQNSIFSYKKFMQKELDSSFMS